MKINLLFYKVESVLKDDITLFTDSYSGNKLNLITANTLLELNHFCSIENHNILLLDVTNDCESIIEFLSEAKIILSKIIVFSNFKEQIFDFVKFGIFDFLILPKKSSEFLSCINKCISKMVEENSLHQLKIAETKFQKFIPINSTKKIELIKLDDIICFEADGRYTLIYLNNGVSKMASKNLGEFQKLLDPDVFCRIHHKFIINMNNLVNIIKSDGFYCEMSNGKNIPVSKRKLEDLNSALNIGKQLY